MKANERESWDKEREREKGEIVGYVRQAIIDPSTKAIGSQRSASA